MILRHLPLLRIHFSTGSTEKANLVRQLSESRAFTVQQILSVHSSSLNLNTVDEQAPISAAASIMVKEEVGSLMVTANGQLAGILTERDYLRASQRESGRIIVKDIMTPKLHLVTVTADTSVTACVSLMAQHQFRHLPVLDSDDRLVGMIGSRTLLQSFLQYHEIQVQHLETFLPYPVW
tara:strand:- start:735 stop:1271 length:537 start_codon:yes stop_codon:yes gene_type:complete